MASITLRSVEKRYTDELVLRDCNLEIRDGEFLVLVGPSGSGKTTLLRIIAGLERLSGGEVLFDDLLVNDVDVGDRDIAMVFQNYGLYPHMTVYNNMAFGLKRRSMSKSEIDEHVRKTADLLDIGQLLTRRPKQLSGGQRQRVALGRAIVRDPAVFLLDEPLSNLDAHLRVQMRGEILKVHRAVTATAVYVTHDQVEALTMGDRIVVMDDGRINQVGTPDELYDHPVNRFVAGFIGTPAMGFLGCVLDRTSGATMAARDGARIVLAGAQAKAVEALPDGERVTVGIRPEHIRIVAQESVDRAESLAHGIVEVVEMLGSEQFVHVDVDGERVTARAERAEVVRAGDKVALAVDGSHVHVFDAVSGDAYR